MLLEGLKLWSNYIDWFHILAMNINGNIDETLDKVEEEEGKEE